MGHEVTMRLGVNVVHDGAVALARTAEALGYDIVLAPEGNRSDAATVLGAIAVSTDRIALGSAVMQVPARTPALAALTAATLDELSAGRFRLGLGVSNPDVATGWYGQPFARSGDRLREYVEIVRAALRRESVRYRGDHYRLPPDGVTGSAPLRLSTPPVRADLPISLAAVGPRNLELAARIADGWIGVFPTPERVAEAAATVQKVRGGLEGFDLLPCVAAAVADDPEQAADQLRAHVTHLLCLGDPDRNPYCRLARGLGYGRAVDTVQEHRRAGDLAAAAAAVPFAFIDRTALVGPVGRVAHRMAEYAAAGATTLSIMVSAADTTPAGRLRILHDVAAARARL